MKSPRGIMYIENRQLRTSPFSLTLNVWLVAKLFLLDPRNIFYSYLLQSHRLHPPSGETIHVIPYLSRTSLEQNHKMNSPCFTGVLSLLYSWFYLSLCHFKPSHWRWHPDWSPCCQYFYSIVTSVSLL